MAVTGRPPTYVACPHCGAPVTLTLARWGHEGCTRLKREYAKPPRYAKRPRKRPEDEIILRLTREQISERIAGMGTRALARMAARLRLVRGAGPNEWKRAE